MFDKNNQFKTVITDNTCKELIHNTINKVCNVVGSSLGPAGRLTALRRAGGTIHLTKDGVSIAKNLEEMSSFEESVISKILLQAAEKTAFNAGDSTTSTLVLAQDIYNQVYSLEGHHNYNEIKRGIDHAVKEVLEKVEKRAIEISSEEDIKSVALVSSNNDHKVADLVAEAYFKLGKNALIYTKESDLQATCSINYLEGFIVDRGFESAKFVTNEVDEKCVLENPYVLMTEEKINSIFEIDKILQAVKTKGRSIMILARDFAPNVINDLVSYRMQNLKVCAAKSPDFGDQRKRTLEDIATVLGGQIISMENGVTFSQLSFAHLGECASVEVSKNVSKFSGGKGDSEKIQSRIDLIESQMNGKDVDDLYTKHKYVERLSRLRGVIATIIVGANTESERGELKDRFEDAIFACKVALAKGVVPGGGSVFAKMSYILPDDNDSSKDFRIGANVITLALLSPIRKLLTNAGYEESQISKIIFDVQISGKEFGFNVLTGKMVNLLDEGIIEPVAVLEESLKNAASVASSLILTDNIIF